MARYGWTAYDFELERQKEYRRLFDDGGCEGCKRTNLSACKECRAAARKRADERRRDRLAVRKAKELGLW